MTSLGSATRGLDELFKEAGSVHNILVCAVQRRQLTEGKYSRDVTWLGAVAYRVGVGGFYTPPPSEIPKALQNRAKLNPIVKNVENC